MADARDRIRDALETHLTDEQLKTLFDEVLAMSKPARGWCSNCKHAVQVTIPDAKAVTTALMELGNRVWGRPGQETDPGEEQGVVFHRVVLGDELVPDGWRLMFADDGTPSLKAK